MLPYRPLDEAVLRAVLVGATPEQRAWLGGASGDQRQLDGADAAADELFCRAMARAAGSEGCRHTRRQTLQYVQGELPRRRRQVLEAHLAGCSDCAWVVEMLPAVADAVGSVAAVYADTVVGPPEAPADSLRRPVPTTAPRPRKRAVAAAVVLAVGLAGAGAAVARTRQADETSGSDRAGGVAAAPTGPVQQLPAESRRPGETQPPADEPSQAPSPSTDLPETTSPDAAELGPGQGVLRPSGPGSRLPLAFWQTPGTGGASSGSTPAGSTGGAGTAGGGASTGGGAPSGPTTPTGGATPGSTGGATAPSGGGTTPSGGATTPGGGGTTPSGGATTPPDDGTGTTPGAGDGPEPGGGESPPPTSDPGPGTGEPGGEPGTETPPTDSGTDVPAPEGSDPSGHP